MSEEDFFRIACENADDGILLQDLDAKILWANPAYARIMQRPLDDMIGRNPLEFCMPPDVAPSAEEVAAFRYDPDDPCWKELTLAQNIRPSGERFWMSLRTAFHRLRSGEYLAILVCRDVTDQVENEARLTEKSRELHRMAHTDLLTGLANRAGLLAFTEDALARRGETSGHVGLIQIDLDHFKQVNDSHGHAAGDALLAHVAGNLKAGLRQSDLIARIGGDEFVVVCRNIASQAQLQRLASSLCAAVRTPLQIDGKEIVPSISVGAALSSDATEMIDDLLSKADFALYDVKRRGRGSASIYDARLHQQFQRRVRRTDALTEAVQAGQIHFAFQPTVEVGTGRIRGLEAFVRWQRDDGTDRDPRVFLPLAAELGLLGEIDILAHEAAVRMGARLKKAGLASIRTGFNSSEAFLQCADVLDRCTAARTAQGVDASNMVIEVPERVLIEHKDAATDIAKNLAAFRDAGYAILLDGFGAGHAGFLQAMDLQVSGIKISAEMTSRLTDTSFSRKIAAMIGELSDELNLYCVVTGVETPQEAATLEELGLTVAQGFWYAPPFCEDRVMTWLGALTRSSTGQPMLPPALPTLRRTAI